MFMQGIDMLIKEFNYHIAYKRWDDSFSAVPFKPKWSFTGVSTAAVGHPVDGSAVKQQL